MILTRREKLLACFKQAKKDYAKYSFLEWISFGVFSTETKGFCRYFQKISLYGFYYYDFEEYWFPHRTKNKTCRHKNTTYYFNNNLERYNVVCKIIKQLEDEIQADKESESVPKAGKERLGMFY
jgi:hypothetical protein